jgi:deoxyribose-phosphate aldolase
MSNTQQSIASYIDHTLLKPEATPQQIEVLCAEALAYSFYSVCVNGIYVPLCARLLAGSPVAVCAVVGFPLGAMSTATKVFEAEDAIRAGTREVDMVLAVGRLCAGDAEYVREDIAAVVAAAHRLGARCKVIFETSLLTDEQKLRAAALCLDTGADFVKTSTGFGGGGATVADVALLRQAVGERAGVKASGGIRGYADAQAMLAAGATRLGTSAGVKIMLEAAGALAEAGDEAY